MGAKPVTVRVVSPGDPWAPALEVSLGEYRVYDDALYAGFDADLERTERYRAALDAMDLREKVVLDIGTGANLFWALECVRRGARKVYAIEELAPACESAQALIVRLGLGDRLQLVRGNSRTVSLPERADVCVSEIIGYIGSSEGAPAILADAMSRHLKDDAAVIPERCVTKMAGVRLPEALHQAPALHASVLPYLGRMFEDVGHPFDPRFATRHFPPSALVTGEGVFEDVSFHSPRTESSHHAQLPVRTAGRMDGLLLWIELFCGGGQPPIDSLFDSRSWAPVYLPVTYPGVILQEGDSVDVRVEVTLSDDGVHPDYRVTLDCHQNRSVQRFHFASMHHGEGFRSHPFTQRVFPP